MKDLGLLILRVGIGVLFIKHGWPKFTGGPERWTQLGQAMSVMGITFWPLAWGFLAMVAEFFGGIMLVVGLFFRISAGMIAFTMLVATLMMAGKGFPSYAHSLAMLIVMASLLVSGAGRFSLADKMSVSWLK